MSTSKMDEERGLRSGSSAEAEDANDAKRGCCCYTLRAYRRTVIAVIAASIIYIVWFIIGLCIQGQRSGWSFNTSGLIQVSVHIAIVFVTGIIAGFLLRLVSKKISHQQLDTKDEEESSTSTPKNRSCGGLLMQILMPLLCIYNTFGFYWYYVPLQSNFFVWLLRWLPWAVLTLLLLIPILLPCYYRNILL